MSAHIADAMQKQAREDSLEALLDEMDREFGPPSEAEAKAIGRLCGTSGHPDVVDVHVALDATERGHHVVTSDPDDIRAVNPSLRIIPI